MEGTPAVEFFDVTQPPTDLPEQTLALCSEFGFLDDEYDPLSQQNGEWMHTSPMEIYWDNPDSVGVTQLRLSFRTSVDHEDDVTSILKLDPASLHNGSQRPTEGIDGSFRKTFLDLVKRLAVAFDPALVTSYHSYYFTAEPSAAEVIPQEAPIELGHLPWLGIYGEELLEQFGGRERVLQTPAWRVEELETGSVLIIKTREPWENYGRDQAADRYLLDGEG